MVSPQNTARDIAFNINLWPGLFCLKQKSRNAAEETAFPGNRRDIPPTVKLDPQ